MCRSMASLRSTAGARSGKYAAQLGKEGFTNVRNMKGSLVSWVRALLYCCCHSFAMGHDS